MPSYLGFDDTRVFRDFIIGRTLLQPNGPQTFTASNYRLQDLTDYANVDPGDVVTGSGVPLAGGRDQEITQTKAVNIYKPENYVIREHLETLPRRANLNLYPYFEISDVGLVGIMSSDNFDNESELFKFAAKYIKDDRNGPVQARIAQNLYSATIGRARAVDAVQGNLASALNILTGREPLIEANNKITVASTTVGKAIDFMETVAGVTLPFSEIPGSYLTDPLSPINYRPEANTAAGRLIQDVTGFVGSIFGIRRRPKRTTKPSDLFLEYTGSGPKKNLFNLISLSTYGPNYSTTARSQNVSGIFRFLDRIAQGFKTALGLEAPDNISYIGDDRDNDVKYAMTDKDTDVYIRSPYYLTLLFDEEVTRRLHIDKSLVDGGSVGGNLTWISSKSKNKIGTHNINYNDQSSSLEDSFSTDFQFREDSILSYTQGILELLPDNGRGSRSHIGNVIDQTSRFFVDGEKVMSKGSNVKYVDKFTGEESGVEFCRVWTKDRPYLSMNDLIKKKRNIRKFDSSILDSPYRLNITPYSNGMYSFPEGSNIQDGYTYGGGYYAKKYMFSIENLAWKTSTLQGFTVQDLPACERGPNGGRVMWFPPYDVKISEQNNAKWEENSFLGRPEPIYTYQNTTRTGQLSFKVVVDHPSILNLLVKKHFELMSDEEADNYINAFFAGCKDEDLYELVQKYPTLDKSDVEYLLAYLNQGGDTQTIKKYKTVLVPTVEQKEESGPAPADSKNVTVEGEEINVNVNLKFNNDQPVKGSVDYITPSDYGSLTLTDLSTRLTTDLNTLTNNPQTPVVKSDNKKVFGKETYTVSEKTNLINQASDSLNTIEQKSLDDFNILKQGTEKLKEHISGGTVSRINIEIGSSTSILGFKTKNYNFLLSFRRSYSIMLYILKQIQNNNAVSSNIEQFRKDKLGYVFNDLKDNGGPYNWDSKEIFFKDLGYNNVDGSIIFNVINYGENGTVSESSSGLGCNSGKFQSVANLNITAPISVACRQSTVKFNYKTTPKQPDPVKSTTVNNPDVNPKPDPLKQTRLEEDGEITVGKKNKKPPIDVMKRIIMKTLSECFYFKALEETSPIQFNSLKEKLKYFHPAFHSTTPEGLNSRLTFLHQCIRPGDTIPIKGKVDDTDLNARNTSFGPPPICILRFGDFYHSKIVIRDVGISYDDNVWDMNPEGIGFQPMIANVQLQISFIGGQGLERPVERLQNALSSNFYANTEMYDERSIPTNKKIDGRDAEQFTKEFLEQIKPVVSTDTLPKSTTDPNNVVKGEFIGKLDGEFLSYSERYVLELYKNTENYFEKYKNQYRSIVNVYGPDVTSLLFLPKYRTINSYDVIKNSGGSIETINMLGVYRTGRELTTYVSNIKDKLISYLDNIPSISDDLLNIDINSNKFNKSDSYLKPWFIKTIGDIVDSIITNGMINDLEQIRDEIIKIFDKTNFIIRYEQDGKIEDKKVMKVDLSGFTSNLLYNEIKEIVDYFQDNHNKLITRIDRTIDFNNLNTITNDDCKSIIRDLLYTKEKKYENQIEDLYKADTTTFRPKIEVKRIMRAVNRFIRKPDNVDFKNLKRFPKPSSKKLTFGAINLSEMTDSTQSDILNKVNLNSNNMVTTKLNYYRK